MPVWTEPFYKTRVVGLCVPRTVQILFLSGDFFSCFHCCQVKNCRNLAEQNQLCFCQVCETTYCSFLGLVLMSPSTVMSEKSILNLLSSVAILHRNRNRNRKRGMSPAVRQLEKLLTDKSTDSSWKSWKAA